MSDKASDEKRGRHLLLTRGLPAAVPPPLSAILAAD
jgi:hypothetical protein